jgi:hypothetical protein
MTRFQNLSSRLKMNKIERKIMKNFLENIEPITSEPRFKPSLKRGKDRTYINIRLEKLLVKWPVLIEPQAFDDKPGAQKNYSLQIIFRKDIESDLKQLTVYKNAINQIINDDFSHFPEAVLRDFISEKLFKKVESYKKAGTGEIVKPEFEGSEYLYCKREEFDSKKNNSGKPAIFIPDKELKIVRKASDAEIARVGFKALVSVDLTLYAWAQESLGTYGIKTRLDQVLILGFGSPRNDHESFIYDESLEDDLVDQDSTVSSQRIKESDIPF